MINTNVVVLTGRLTKDVELRKTTSGTSTCRFTLAVQRRFKEKETDFIQCVAWQQSADFISKYAHKGDIVGVTGRIQTGSYEGQNGRVYTTDIVCDSVQIISNEKKEFKPLESHIENEDGELYNEQTQFYNPSQGIQIDSDELPFY